MWRLYSEHRRRSRLTEVDRVVVVGAGDAGHQVIRTMLSADWAPFTPVALVDDDPMKRRLRLGGVRVEGSVDELEQVARRTGASAALIAVPSAGSAFTTRVANAARDAGLTVFTLPPVEKLFGHVDLADIHPVSERDVLGRRPADIDSSLVSADLTGRRVLVTGAGGSIGGELCRQLALFDPAELLMLDRNESGLHATQLAIEGAALLDDPALILADLRDAERIDEVFATMRPDVVFHAAALKHLPLLELHPEEAWKTNVVGTQVLLDAARRHGVRRFVNISTDKAADPISVLGSTKRIAERLTAEASRLGPTECVSVRFGNVLGSAGSMLPDVRGANSPRWPADRHPSRGHPVLHDHRRSRQADDLRRLDRRAGRAPDPRHGRAGADPRHRRTIRASSRSAARHRVHRPPHEREAARGADRRAPKRVERRVHPLITHVAVPPLPAAAAAIGGSFDTDWLRALALGDEAASAVFVGADDS